MSSEEEILQIWNSNIQKSTTHRCSVDCTDLYKNTIICLSQEHFLYGCEQSGYTHQCIIDKECEICIMNHDSEYVCIFSGRVNGIYVEQNPYNDRVQFGVQHDVADIGCQSVQRSDLSERRYTRVHKVPRQITVEELGERTEKLRQRRLEKDLKEKYEQSLSIIDMLLWSNDIRRQINEEQRNQFITRIIRTSNKSMNKGTIYSYDWLTRQFDELVHQEMLLKITPQSIKERNRIAAEVQRLWLLIEKSTYYQKNKSKIHFSFHVLGTLELMKTGFHHSTVQVEQNTFVATYILTTKQIAYYGNRIRLSLNSEITSSLKQIKQCLIQIPS